MLYICSYCGNCAVCNEKYHVMTIPLLLLSIFTFVELNCENLFDCRHDSLKNDTEFLPDGAYHWTPTRYWRKLDRVGQTIIACGDGPTAADWRLPDMVALCEVENDSVMTDLTRRSLLRGARYDYVMTSSPDERGMDVALMFSPFSFRLIGSRSVRIVPARGMRPTRDLLYASGLLPSGDTLHVVVAHLPSRRGGERQSRPFRRLVAERICGLIDSVRCVSPDASILVAGDFNDYTGSESVRMICGKGMADVSEEAAGSNGARGTYRYQGEWGSLDHILASASMVARLRSCRVLDAKFLVERDAKYGGVKPRRNYLGPRYLNGFSDHLPLVAVFDM